MTCTGHDFLHGGPVVAAEDKSETHRCQHCRRDCSVAPTAADGQAHRQADRRVCGNGEPGAQTRRSFPADIEPAEPVRRHERERPGEMIHDRTRQSSRRGKGWRAGWDHVHVAIDDASRVAFSQILSDGKKDSGLPFSGPVPTYSAATFWQLCL
ncbi:IS481 family insertion sequence transposase domain-containing protein (plasmid) [Rhizobium etli]|uniref:IS481 family insertion sequence transposase domain-containing protein n=1 Tax=Rhizobium etli TaxID=29449 RepID=A0AAN1BL42_RHIET|nr:IS481 family insertion sequence transposase domain-containing protein [Rhizobium etli]